MAQFALVIIIVCFMFAVLRQISDPSSSGRAVLDQTNMFSKYHKLEKAGEGKI